MEEPQTETEVETQEEPQDPLASPVTPEDEPETPSPDETSEPDEGQPGDQDEAVESGTTASLRSEKEIEEAGKKVEKLREHVARRIGDIFLDDAIYLKACPMCAGTAPGWLWPPDVAPLPDDQLRAIFALLGVTKPEEYEQHPSYATCEECNGVGRVKTGSRVPGYDVVDCPRCFAKGYIQVQPITYGAESGNGEASAVTVTGPTVYQDLPPQEDYADDPAVADLKRRGFVVVPPMKIRA